MENISISDMNNEELKNSIKKHNDDKLNNIYKSSYLNAFGAILSLVTILDKPGEFEYLNNVSEVEVFKKHMDSAIDLINISLGGEKPSENLDKAKRTRNEIYEFLKIVEGYYIELSYIGNIVDHYGLEINSKAYDKQRNNNINIEKTVKIIHDKLEYYKNDYSMYNHIISQIVEFIPIRLTKDKYINILENALLRNLDSLSKEEVEDKINYYKRQWDSSLQYGYAFKFDKYFSLIQKIKTIDFQEKDLEALEELVKEIVAITKELNELYNFILIMGLTYNMIISIYLDNQSRLDNEILEIKDQWNNILKSPDEIAIKEFMKINEAKIRQVENDTIEYIDEFQEMNEEAVKRQGFTDSDLEDVFLQTKEILTYYNDYKLGNINILLNTSNETVSAEYLDEWIKSLTSYIKRSLNTMDNIERKVRMKKLLSLIELPFSSINEFEDYIRYSLNDRIASSRETLFIMDNLIAFIKNIENNTKD